MTTVASVMRRSYLVGMFDDVTDATPCAYSRDRTTGVVTLDFAGALTAEQQADVFERMESRNDVDQSKRAVLRERRDALAEGDTVRLAIDYVLDMP